MKGGMAVDFDISFATSDNNIKNLITLSAKKADLFTLNLCEISEIADACVSFCKDLDNMNIYEILTLFSEDLREVLDIRADNNKGRPVASFLATSAVAERAEFCRLLIERMRASGFDVSENSFLGARTKPESFTYVRNPLSDEAYDVFSQSFSDPRLKYAAGIKEAVNLLTDGETGYCLLPIEERGGVRLPTVAELIFTNDLKIISITPVFGPDGTANMKYALLAASFNRLDIDPNDDRYFEFRISADSALPLSELLAVSDIYNLKPYRINTAGFGNTGVNEYSLVMYASGADFTPLLTYLTMFSNAYTPIGIYTNVD